MSLVDFFRRPTFSHGIHPRYHKEQTQALPIRRLPFPKQLFLPLNQHIGKPSRPLVSKGQEVIRGQPLAAADGHLSVPLHAPATGRVHGIELRPGARGAQTPTLVLDVYASSTQEVAWRAPQAIERLSREQLLDAIKQTGMVGMGGAAFPSHAKLAVPADKPLDALLVNGCECEPYLTCDYRLMLERGDELLGGVRYAMRACGAPRAVIGIEDNKLDAAQALRAKLRGCTDIEVRTVRTKYPQGSEKMLIKALTGRTVPSGRLPLDVGVVVNNVGTLAELGRLLPRGEGMTERVITVCGPGVERPGNYLVPLGTPLDWVLQQVGYSDGVHEFILGGPMMGSAASSLDTPVTKGVSGLLVLDEPQLRDNSRPGWSCIRCGRCVEACPMHLNPSQLGLLASNRLFPDMAEHYHLNDCFECGCCSYVCPSRIPLVQYFRLAKASNRDRAA